MGLTSGSFATVMFVLAGLGLAGVVLGWPLAARRRAMDVQARVLMIVVSQLFVIAAFLVALNGYFGFYASWSELLGTGTPQIVGVARQSNSNDPLLAVIRAGPARLPGVPAAKVTARPTVAERHGSHGSLGSTRGGHVGLAQTGELLQVSISGAHTGIAVGGDYVYLPPQYFQPAYAHTRFPAILALTGYPGSSSSIVRRLKLPSVQASLVSQGKVRPTVDVMMNVSVAMPRDTECTNIPAGPQVETFFAEDVPLAIERAFRVQSGPGSWAAIGYSTGGLCAVKLAMMYPHQFSLAVSLAGDYAADEDSTTGNLYGDVPGYRDLNSPDWRLQHLPAPPISVLVTSSIVGEKSYPQTRQFVSLVRPPMRVYTEYLQQGGHNFSTWERELFPALAWLSSRLTPALPGLTLTVPEPVASTRPAPHRSTGPGHRHGNSS
jgi:S-formylglutathione hydrolase FrmB